MKKSSRKLSTAIATLLVIIHSLIEVGTVAADASIGKKQLGEATATQHEARGDELQRDDVD